MLSFLFFIRLELLENVIAFLQRILTQLNQRNLENDMSGNLSSSDDNLNGANQMINGITFRYSIFF